MAMNSYSTNLFFFVMSDLKLAYVTKTVTDFTQGKHIEIYLIADTDMILILSSV